jgi:hypothetical protein
VVARAAASFAALYELGRRWGATGDELARAMPGTGSCAIPKVKPPHGVTIADPTVVSG